MSFYGSYFNYTNISIVFNLSAFENGSCFDENGSLQCDLGSELEELSSVEILVVVFLSGFILSIIIGNCFVILSVALFREMRTLTNGMIVSLASADLLVAILVLPISLYNEVVGTWSLGQLVCDAWITSDVFCCTASILNIVVIAVDRYWLITKNVHYTHNTTFSRQKACMVMALLAWVASAIISSSPLLGWRRGDERDDPSMCIISQDLGYTIFSTFGSFWFPLSVILIVYYKIFKIARRRALTRAKARAVHPSFNSTMMSEMNGKAASARLPKHSDSNSPQDSPAPTPNNSENRGSYRTVERRRLRLRRGAASTQSRGGVRYRGRMRSSARTLGLIIGGFVLCWLPFFLLATIMPFCSVCDAPRIVGSVVLWLGYSNSLLNPAIYAIWDKNFRRSFKRLATCDIRCNQIFR